MFRFYKNIDIFFKKEVFKGGGNNVAKGGTTKKIFMWTHAKCAPAHTNALVRPCTKALSDKVCIILYMHVFDFLDYLLSFMVSRQKWLSHFR